jgi:hypothetical protein
MAAFPAYWYRVQGGFPSDWQWKAYAWVYRPAFEHQPRQVLWKYVMTAGNLSDLEMFLFVQGVTSPVPTPPHQLFEFNMQN